ncbi:uncharacterized protein LOC125370834 [Ricinus communis]|uniref:uncharacterized protein LOC125370834 n=1 Tax=Ricinus communis TaxID=3988 RepID=UPI00201AB78C|nr:uncharacterized protein LOC125370834 [Ricinus communis]
METPKPNFYYYCQLHKSYILYKSSLDMSFLYRSYFILQLLGKGQKRVQDMRLLVLALALMVVAGSCLAAGNRKALAFESHEPEKLRDLIKDDFSKHPDSSNDRENGHHEIPLGKFSPPSG